MTKKLFDILLILSLLIPNLATSQSIVSSVDSLYKVNNNQPGFSIAVFKGNEILLEKQYGTAYLDYGIPITNETVFDIGSIAKQFTAAAILLLENEGKLSLKEPAYKYIDKLPRYKKGDPTIEQLLNQTSGIPEVDPYFYLTDLSFNDLLTQSRVSNIIVNLKELNFKPGDYFEYTNTNYILLANIIEKVSEKPFVEYLQEHIFSPLKMESTIKKNNTYNIIKNRAIGYIEDEGAYYKMHLHSAIYNGDGQIMTTSKDMFNWHQGIRNSTIGTPELWKKMHTKAKLNDGTIIDFGLGVEFETHNGYSAMGFDGMIMGGFVSKYLYFPELDIAFFTTQNTFEEDFEERFFQLVDLYITNKEQDNTNQKLENVIIELPKDELKKYEGSYIFLGNEYEDIRTGTIKLKENILVLKTRDGEEIGKLEPLGSQKFLMGGNIIEFDTQANKKQYKFYANENEKPWLFKEFEPYGHTELELKELEGIYLNKSLQVAKEVKFEDGKLQLHYGRGAYSVEMKTLSKDLFNIPNYPIQFKRNKNGEIISIKIMGLEFEKI
ncbi:serine hydrolase domain-containing protein [Zobellia galactanivorans]|uniref:serine hydrolase domain-containing protein n=1 Tax=Zobellia galactanivorans (strain DSM 12802 / CCUG 47099 / CIP 106680 / NCIMB 13871 / Dsij) TaxID=63186 RepID=UPI0026E1CE73|nr:serine hydrolase domain-containing protein [Zobellia galactanivorans]MDO6808816.1 serine hydrolase domain-containing protein [Zobellia galactanivorans]